MVYVKLQIVSKEVKRIYIDICTTWVSIRLTQKTLSPSKSLNVVQTLYHVIIIYPGTDTGTGSWIGTRGEHAFQK